MDRMEALSYWVISDHFEQAGEVAALFHNGFGLLTVGNLRKPRYWAAHLAAHQGDDVLAGELGGDGADVLVRSWATRHDDGTVDVLVWNGTVDGALLYGAPHLDRTVRVTVTGLDVIGYRGAPARIDQDHSNILAGYPRDDPRPDATLWRELRARDRLHEEDAYVFLGRPAQRRDRRHRADAGGRPHPAHPSAVHRRPVGAEERAQLLGVELGLLERREVPAARRARSRARRSRCARARPAAGGRCRRGRARSRTAPRPGGRAARAGSRRWRGTSASTSRSCPVSQ